MWSFRRDPSVVQMLAQLYGRPQEDTAVPVLLDTPKCATQLVALTGQALGSMDRHLRVLLDTGLVQRRRAGRPVLYYHMEAGQTLVQAQPR